MSRGLFLRGATVTDADRFKLLFGPYRHSAGLSTSAASPRRRPPTILRPAASPLPSLGALDKHAVEADFGQGVALLPARQRLCPGDEQGPQGEAFRGAIPCPDEPALQPVLRVALVAAEGPVVVS